MTSSVDRRILRTTLIVGVASLLPKAALVVRDLAIAAHFGTGDQVDAFLLAVLLPSVAVQIVVQPFATSLIPIFIHRRETDGPSVAADLSGRAAGYGLGAAAVLGFLMALCGTWLIRLVGPGFPPAKQVLALGYLYWLTPLVLLQGAAAIWSALLNALGRYAAVSCLPVATPALVLVVLAWPSGGMTGVAVATLAGGVVEASLAAILLRQAGLPLWRAGTYRNLREVLTQTLPMSMGMALSSGSLVVDQLFASFAASGGVAVLAYGNKIPAFLISLAALPLGVAVLPHFSEQAARTDWVGLRRSLRLWSIVVLAATIPAVLGLITESEWIVRLVFQRGRFSGTDTTLVALVQQCYLLQVPLFLLVTLGVRMMIALGLTRQIMLIAGANFVLNGVLDLALFNMIGLPGIALSTSVVSASSAGLVFLSLVRRLRIPR